MQKNNCNKILIGFILGLVFCYSQPSTIYASSIKLITPINEEVIDASQPYVLKGEQEGVTRWSFDFEPIKDNEACHNKDILFLHLPNGYYPNSFTISATTTSFEELLDFSIFTNKLSEKISYNVKIRDGYANGALFDEKIVKFKNIPGRDWCDNPWFAFLEFYEEISFKGGSGRGGSYSLDSTISFFFRMAGAEKIIMDYGDGTITEFSAKNLYGGGTHGLFPHKYEKPGDYTVIAKVVNFKGDILESSVKFGITAPRIDPVIHREEIKDVLIKENKPEPKVVNPQPVVAVKENIVIPVSVTPIAVSPVIVKDSPKIIPIKKSEQESKPVVVKNAIKNEVISSTSTYIIKDIEPASSTPLLKTENRTFFQSIIFNLKKIFSFW